MWHSNSNHHCLPKALKKKRQQGRKGWKRFHQRKHQHTEVSMVSESVSPQDTPGQWWVIWKWSISKCYWWAKLPDSLSEAHIRHMLPQLLPPVAATTIGTPTQKTPSDRNPAAAACAAATVFTFYFVLLAVCLPLSQEWLETHTHSMSKNQVTCRTHACTLHVCACVGIHQVNGEKTRCQLQKQSCLVGEGEPGRLPARAASRQCAFLKTLRRAGLGEWLFKTLGSFYFTTMEVNSALKCQSKWSHLVSAGSLCILAAEVRLDESRKVQLKLFFLPIKIDSTEDLAPGLHYFGGRDGGGRDTKVTENVRDTEHWNECWQR